MNKFILHEYVNYNHWANRRLMEHCDRPLMLLKVPSSFNTLAKTWLHIWDAQVIWMERLQGSTPVKMPSSRQDMAPNMIPIALHNSDQEWISWLENQSDESLRERYDYQTTRGNSYRQARWETVMHCMNHSTYHRGQIVTMLHHLSQRNIPATDFVFYKRDT